MLVAFLVSAGAPTSHEKSYLPVECSALVGIYCKDAASSSLDIAVLSADKDNFLLQRGCLFTIAQKLDTSHLVERGGNHTVFRTPTTLLLAKLTRVDRNSATSYAFEFV